MLGINDLKIGANIQLDGDPYTVTWSQHSKQARSAGVMRTKLKNLLTGNTIEKTFQGSDKIYEADLARGRVNYLYKDEDNLYFMNNETYEQFSMPVGSIGENIKFMKEGEDVDVLYFEGNPVNISLPTKISLKVIQAPPGVKGDTAQGGSKQITLETEVVINAPLFIKEGDIVRVNTETGEYVERL